MGKTWQHAKIKIRNFIKIRINLLHHQCLSHVLITKSRCFFMFRYLLAFKTTLHGWHLFNPKTSLTASNSHSDIFLIPTVVTVLHSCIYILCKACLFSVTGALPYRSLPKFSPLSSPATSTRNWILCHPPPLPPKPQKSRNMRHHHPHPCVCKTFDSFMFCEEHFIHDGQYFPNLDCIFRRGEHQSVIHPSAPSHALSSGWEIDLHDSTIKVWALLLFNNSNVYC